MVDVVFFFYTTATHSSVLEQLAVSFVWYTLYTKEQNSPSHHSVMVLLNQHCEGYLVEVTYHIQQQSPAITVRVGAVFSLHC